MTTSSPTASTYHIFDGGGQPAVVEGGGQPAVVPIKIYSVALDFKREQPIA